MKKKLTPLIEEYNKKTLIAIISSSLDFTYMLSAFF